MDDLILRLKRALGTECVSTDPAELVAYAYDATGLEGRPRAVAHALNTRDVSVLLALADEARVPVYPRGAGSGLTGGSVPSQEGIVLDLSGMRRIVSIEPENLTAVVEPGVVVAELQKAVEKVGLFYPPDPASSDFATIGGTIAECAGGLRAFKYGVTRDYVLSLEAVLPGGVMFRTGTATMKNVTGYDLTRLLVGSEGTLAVITQATLKLIPLPESAAAALAFFKSEKEAIESVNRIVAAGFHPRALEFIDKNTYEAVYGHEKFDYPPGVEGTLLVEVDGPKCYVGGALDSIVELLRAGGAFKVAEARDAPSREELWRFRKAVSPALLSRWAARVNEDICVPRSRLVETFAALHRIGLEQGVKIANFGHLGDGNIHVNILLKTHESVEREHAHQVAVLIFKETVRVGGTLSGEHGIGMTKAAFLDIELSKTVLELMRSVKRLFDPKGILNPGKVFPMESRGERE